MMTKKFRIAEIIANFLKYIEFIRSAPNNTIRSYRSDLNQAFKFQDSENPSNTLNITAADLLSMARKAQHGWAKLSASSRNRKAATLKSFLHWAYQEKITETDLSEQIHCPSIPKKLPSYLSVDEVTSVIRSFTENQLKEKTLFFLLYGAGLRINEACNIKWKDIQLSQGTIRVLGKGNKTRIVSLPRATLQCLANWKHAAPSGEYLFGAKPLCSRTAFNLMIKCGEQAGLHSRLNPHKLRHSYATHLLSGGANIRILQQLLGHASLTATEKYTHLSIDHLARTMESLHPISQRKKNVA